MSLLGKSNQSVDWERRIADGMEELRQLTRMATLDDFQDFRRKRLEYNLNELRQELRHFDPANTAADLNKPPTADQV